MKGLLPTWPQEKQSEPGLQEVWQNCLSSGTCLAQISPEQLSDTPTASCHPELYYLLVSFFERLVQLEMAEVGFHPLFEL